MHKKILGSDNNRTTLIISNDEMEDIMKLVKSLEDSSLLLKGFCETIQNEAKEQKERFLGMLFGTLGARLLGNMLAGKGITKVGYGSKERKWIIEAVYGSKYKFSNTGFLIQPHPLTNFETQKYYQN